MALSEPRIVFGIHSATPYSRSTGLPYGILKVLGGSSISMAGEMIKLNGGSSRYPWAIENGLITAEITLKPREYPDFLWTLFLGKAPTANSAETGGSVTTLTQKSGSTLVNASTGIASVGIESGEEADLKFGNYVVKAVSSTTVDVYLASDVDISRGDDLTYQDDNLKITASPLTIPGTSATVSIPNTGLEFTGGSGTVSFTADETATFTTRPINDKSMDVVIGSTEDLPIEFGMIMITQQRSNGEMFEIDAHRCKGIGMPLNFEENAFSEAEIPVEAFYDQTVDKVLTFRHVTPT